MKSLLRLLTILALTTIITATPLWLRKQPSMEFSTYKNKTRQTRAIEDYLLPKNIKPETYDIQLLPFLNEPKNLPESLKFTVEGTIEIICLILQDTDTIVMHALDMEIYQESITVVNLTPPSNFGVLTMTMSEESDKRQFLTIKLNGVLVKDSKYSITMNFKSKVNNLLEGFYRSSYTDSSGKER
jgi:aminopeptidase N